MYILQFKDKKRTKPKELSTDMRDRIIERHKGGEGYRKFS